MAFYARYPIAQAPGMGENFFFVFSAIPAATAAGFANGWQVALGTVFISGVLFLILSVIGLREMIFNAVSPSLKIGIAAGIGLFIAFIGCKTRADSQGPGNGGADKWASPRRPAGVLRRAVADGGAACAGARLDPQGIAGATAGGGFKLALPHLPPATAPRGDRSALARRLPRRGIRPRRSWRPRFRVDLANALTPTMLPFIFVFSSCWSLTPSAR
jgi:AGZA family xanthine/uracil permease-like MFS transporter